MKKVKFLSVAVAVAALASCQSDDLSLAGSDVKLASDGSEVFVTINDVEESIGTRAGFSVYEKTGTQAMTQMCLFEAGDQFKMYCSDTWKPQLYEFKQMANVSGASADVNAEGAVFKYADPNSPYNAETSQKNREYGVFPADLFKFNDEYRGKLVFELPTTNNYGGLAITEIDKKVTDNDVVSAWHALVPMFGIYKPSNTTVGFYYMTSLIRVQALGMTPNEQHTLTLSSKKYKLSGTFETESFNSAEFDVNVFDKLTGTALNEAAAAALPVFNREEAKGDDSKSISVTFTPTATNPDVVIYLPLPTGEYEVDDLTLTLDEKDITDKVTYRTRETDGYVYTPLSELTGKTLTLGRGVTNTNLYAIVENNVAREVTTLKDINDLLAELAESYDRDVTVDVNIKGNGIVVNDLESEIESYRKLMVPKLPYNVTLNINGKITAAEGKKLNIIGVGGEGTLTINYLYNEDQTDFAPIAIADGFANDVVLKTTADANGKYVKFAGLTAPKLTGNLTLEGMFADINGVNVEGTLTLKNYVHHIGSTWKNQNSQVVTFGAKTVTIEGDCSKMACAVAGGNPNNFVKQDDPIRTVTFDFGKESTVTFGEGANVYGVKAGTVTVDEDAEVSAVETSKKLTITDAQVNAITLNGGEATIDAVDKTINTVVLKAPATINLNNGIINTISKTYTYDKNETNGATKTVAKVNSKGKSAIVDVTEVGNWINFYSEWNGEEISYPNFSYCTAIYTAAQFMNVSQFTFGKYTLYTDVDLNNNEYKLIKSNDAVVQKSRTLANGFEGVVRDNGETTTIKNFTLVNPYDAKMNIGLFGMTSVGYNKVVVKNLHIENVNNSFTKDVENVGVLFGKVTRDIDIENVVVKNASLECLDESYNIGGLIGYVESGNVNVVATTVDAHIEGYYNLGGVIGSVAENAQVTFGKGKNAAAEGVKVGGTTIEVIKKMNDEKDKNAGKVGLAVGELNGKLSLQYFTATWAANKPIDDWKYDKCRFFINDNTMVFKGCKNGSNYRYYVGYSPAAQEFLLQGTEMVKGYNGTTYYDGNKTVTYNIFEKPNE